MAQLVRPVDSIISDAFAASGYYFVDSHGQLGGYQEFVSKVLPRTGLKGFIDSCLEVVPPRVAKVFPWILGDGNLEYLEQAGMSILILNPSERTGLYQLAQRIGEGQPTVKVDVIEKTVDAVISEVFHAFGYNLLDYQGRSGLNYVSRQPPKSGLRAEFSVLDKSACIAEITTNIGIDTLSSDYLQQQGLTIAAFSSSAVNELQRIGDRIEGALPGVNVEIKLPR